MKNNSNKLVYIVSLGCPKNFVDTEVMAASLITGGFGITPSPSNADVYLVNTCAFIPTAREEAEEFIAEALQWKKKKARKRKVVISGCLNQWDTEGVYRKEFPEVDMWMGVNDVAEIGRLLSELFAGEHTEFNYETAEYLYDDTTPRIQLTLPHYAYVKISEGCDNCCAYCSIPKIRGRLRSRTIASVVKEAENLIQYGTKELILIGQDITAFGVDNNTGSLSELIRTLDKLPGDFKIRLLYTHPAHFTNELVDVIASSSHVMPYVDMPLQHISDHILTAMGRKVTKQRVEELIVMLREKIPGIVIRTTFITGFPGETEADYNELRDFVEKYKFERLGVFPYYPEPETPAAAMPEQVSAQTALARSEELMELQSKISLNNNKKLVGKEIDVIVDSFNDDDIAIGRSYMDAPEIDNCIYAEVAPEVNPGDMVRVEILSCTEYDLEGKQTGK